MTEDQFERLSGKIDALIKIQALSAVAHLQTKAEKIHFLHEAGLAPKDIASIVGGKATLVSQAIYDRKKKATKK